MPTGKGVLADESLFQSELDDDTIWNFDQAKPSLQVQAQEALGSSAQRAGPREGAWPDEIDLQTRIAQPNDPKREAGQANDRRDDVMPALLEVCSAPASA